VWRRSFGVSTQPDRLRGVSHPTLAALHFGKTGERWFAHHLSQEQIKAFMDKGERISRFVAELAGETGEPGQKDIVKHPFYRAFFHCWNEKRYYEAHDVLEQLWLKSKSPDADYFKGLIQAAGAFVHLQKRFEYPLHSKHSRRLAPAVRLFRLAESNLSRFAPQHHGLDVAAFCQLLRACGDRIVESDYKINPWSPETAPKLELL
jgi:predicted metal-dependent hydrolase